MIRAVLFDLGNTLAAYYRASDFAPIMERAIRGVAAEIARRQRCNVTIDEALRAAEIENREAPDHRFVPLIERLERIFGLPLAHDPAAPTLCARFLEPIFAVGYVYDDALPTLAELRRAGFRLGVVSNSPWGSPPEFWRNELARLQLEDAVDTVALCGDVGWRKPAPAIFLHAAAALECDPAECAFVGDDLIWDVEGSAAVGMRPVLVDRDERHSSYAGDRIRDLQALLTLLPQR